MPRSARSTSRLGLLGLVAKSVHTAVRPGSPGLADRVAALPRMMSATLRGDYRGTTLAHLALLAGAAFYVVSPLDVMPEALFGVLGLADDAVIATWLAAALVQDTEAFLQWERAGSHSRGGQEADRAASPQDASTDEYFRVVDSRVVR